MSVKSESPVTHADDETADYTLQPQPQQFSPTDNGFQRMSHGLDLHFAQPEEVYPRSSGPSSAGGSDHATPQQQQQQQQRRSDLPGVPLPPLSQLPRPSGPAMTVQQSGPMSSKVTVPARAKPGRKPIAQENQADRRRLQNRNAQRAFRDKRQQKLYDTQAELQEQKELYERNVNELRREVDGHERANKKLRLQLQESEARAEHAELKLRQMQPFTNGNTALFGTQAGAAQPLSVNTGDQRAYGGYGAASVPTPPEDSATYSQNEVDFTGYGRNQHGNGFGQNMMVNMDIEPGNSPAERCGFCTDDQNCACRQEAENVAEPSSVPGNCQACRNDPVKAQACRDLASTAGSMPLSITAPGTACSQIVDQYMRLDQRNGSIADYFAGPVHVAPNMAGGYTIDAQEAAQALTSMSRRNTVVSPNTAGNPF